MTDERREDLADAIRTGIYGDDRMPRADLDAALTALHELLDERREIRNAAARVAAMVVSSKYTAPEALPGLRRHMRAELAFILGKTP